jgi:type II secretory pathway pseudopilin PulG
MEARVIKQREAAFTLIEIVVVLALAALILSGILLAVNAAQQSTRDSQRRSAVSQVESALEGWALTHSNSYSNGGSPALMVTVADLYGNCGSGVTQYLDCSVTAPGTGAKYQAGPVTGPTATNQISITDRSAQYNTQCTTVPGSCTNGYCVTVKLEAGNKEIYGASDTNKSGRNMTGGYCQ